MKKFIFLWLILTGLIFGQAKYFLPVQVTTTTGRPMVNQDVDLYQSGSKIEDLTWLDGGRYYWADTSVVTSGSYSIYVNGVEWQTEVAIYYGASFSLAAIGDIIADSLGIPNFADTTIMKTAYTVKDGVPINLKQLSSANTYGGGFFVQRDSSEIAAKYDSLIFGSVFFNNPIDGKIWASQDFLKKGILNVLWAGVIGDSAGVATEENLDLINDAFLESYYLGTHQTYFPAGVYAVSDSDTVSGYGLQLKMPPDAVVFGDGPFLTHIVRLDTTNEILRNTGSMMTSNNHNWEVRDLSIHGMPGHGRDTTNNSWMNDAELNSGIKITAGYNADSLTTYYPDKVIIENVHVSTVRGEAFAITTPYEVDMRDCRAYDCNLAAYTIQGSHINLQNCYADSVFASIEANAVHKYHDKDSIATITINDFQGYNNWRYGATLRGGVIKVNNFTLTGEEQVPLSQLNSSAEGLEIVSADQHNIDSLVYFELKDFKISHFPKGIFFDGSSGADDTTFQNIIIEDGTIHDILGAPIHLSGADSTFTKGIANVQKVTAYDWGSVVSAGLGFVEADNIDNLNVRFCRAERDSIDVSNFRYRYAVILNNSDNALIANNDFRVLQTGTDNTHIKIDSVSTNYKVIYNEGLSADSAIAWLGNGATLTFYRQFHDPRAFGTWYRSSVTDTLALGVATWTPVYSIDSLDVISGFQNVTESGDTLTPFYDGIYDIYSQVIFRSEDSTYTEWLFNINKNTGNSSAAKDYIETRDTNFVKLSTRKSLYFDGDDYIQTHLRSSTGKDAIIKEYSIDVALIRRDN